MATWTTPIVDRTLDDVNHLKLKIEEFSTIGWDNIPEIDLLWWLYGDSSAYNLIATTDTLVTSDGYILSAHGEQQSIRGCFNYYDLNRIINNTIYLKDLMNSYGYSVSFTNQSLAEMTTLAHFQSVISVTKANVQALLDAFYAIEHPSMNPDSHTIDYIDANAIEMNLKLLYDILNNMLVAFQFSREYYASSQTDYIELCNDTVSFP